MYLLNWVWRILTEPGYRQWIVWVSGLLQTALYADFFYYYYKRCAFHCLSLAVGYLCGSFVCVMLVLIVCVLWV